MRSRRAVVQLSIVVLAVLGVGLLRVLPATADLPNCSDCVETADIANGAVTGEKIMNRSVGNADLKLGAMNYCQMVKTEPRSYEAAPCRTSVSLIEAVRSGGTSIAIGVDGLPVVSYGDSTNGETQIAHCSTVACTSSVKTVIASSPQYSAVAIGVDGLPVVAYSGAGLNVVHCSTVVCTSFTTTEIEASGLTVADPSIAIGADGLPVVSYYESTNDNLKIAHCSTIACTSATKTAIDTTGDVGANSSIAIGADGLPVASYLDATNDRVKIAHCSTITCTSATKTTVVTDALEPSLAIGVDGFPVVSYLDLDDTTNYYRLSVAHCSTIACTSATRTAVDAPTSQNVGFYTSIAIGIDGFPVVSYYNVNNTSLKIAQCSNISCTAATKTQLDPSGGAYTSITIGTDGLPIVSHVDLQNDTVEVARMGA